MEPSPRTWTHRRLIARFLATLLATLAVFAVIALVVAEFWTWELALFACGLGSLIAWLGIAHSHAGICAGARMEPDSKPGAELRVLPWALAAACAALVLLGLERFPTTPIATGAVIAAALGLVWASFRGCRDVRRAGTAP